VTAPGFLRDRKWAIASWVMRIGWVRLISRRAYRDFVASSLEGGFPGACQKLENGYTALVSSYPISNNSGWERIYWFVYASPWANNVSAIELFSCDLESLVEL
jgi:hypothetical protein